MRPWRALLILMAVLVGLPACGSDEPKQLIGYALQPPSKVGDLSLPEATDGKPFEYQPPSGHLIVAYFGYTNCPDVCPTSLAALKNALHRLGDAKAARIQLAMATVDPARDTPEGLTAYVNGFVAGSVALRTTDDAALRAVANRFGVEYNVSTGADGKVEVVHTGSMFIVDDRGEVADVLAFGVTPADIANDLSILLSRTPT